MGSSSFSLPNVERALTEMEGGVGGPAQLSMSSGPDPRKAALGRNTARPSSGLSVPGVGAPGARPQVSSPTLSTSPSPTSGGQTQHEVLQNFFQSLLSSKDRASGSAATSRTTSTSKPATSSPATSPASAPAPASAPSHAANDSSDATEET